MDLIGQEILLDLMDGNPGAFVIINGFFKTLNKNGNDVITKLFNSDKKGSELWVLFLESGGKKPSINFIGEENSDNIPVEEQKEALQKTWDSL